MSIFTTGDTHNNALGEMSRFKPWLFPRGQLLSKEDYIIINGDFGFLWKGIPDKHEKQWLQWFKDQPWTTLFIDGNHSNHVRLKALPQIQKFNSTVGKVNDSVFHLKRGEVYDIDDIKIFTMGGAMSIDKSRRVEWISWWKDEIPSYAEMEYGLSNLEKHNNKVDIIITHTLPEIILKTYNIYIEKWKDPTSIYLDEVLNRAVFHHWYCGHFHEDMLLSDRVSILYNSIQEIKI